MAAMTETFSKPLKQLRDLGSVESDKVLVTLAALSDSEVVPSPSAWTHLCHPRVKEVEDEVHEHFLKNWNFANSKTVQTFLNAKFSEVTCLYFPLALDDRIHFASRLLTVLFLIDDILENMSFADGEAYNAKLMPISRGDVLPDRSEPEEFILYDLWESMRAHHRELADEVLEPTFTFMKAPTDHARLTIKELGQYLDYREKDVGKALLSALMQFSRRISFEKEEHSARTGHKEGAYLCSAVKILAAETNLGITATKRVLWMMARESENPHDQLVAEKLKTSGGCSQVAKVYMKRLEYQMSGNEQWSKTTLRYN